MDHQARPTEGPLRNGPSEEDAQTFPGLDAATPEPSKRRGTRNLVLAGIAAAAVAGLGLAALLHGGAPSAADPDAIEAQGAGVDADHHLQIEIKRRAPPTQAVRQSAGKLDMASTIMQPQEGGPAPVASAAPEQPEARRGGLFGVLGRLFGGDGSGPTAAASQRPEPPARPASRPAAQPSADPWAPAAEPAAQAPQPAQPRPMAASASPSFDCGRIRSRSEQMVCADSDLAAADRRMARAFRAARIAGVPYGLLSEQQQRWYRARERAAFSRDAVAQVYEARIAELQQMASSATPDGEDPSNDW